MKIIIRYAPDLLTTLFPVLRCL
uniref:Uncharacterized protein n=1 Tax=Anguilla anguilla TaxID=7936 RepID=A0A0E9PGB2_ANGAN